MASNTADRIGTIALSLPLLVAFVFGGGGSRQGIFNLIVQLAGLAVLALRGQSVLSFWRQSPRLLRILIALSLLIPLIQIIPLPESVWSALPSRSMVVRSLEQIGESGWMPLSLDPLRTLLALTALITPLAVLCAGWSLPRERLIDIGWVVVGLGLVTVMLALVQLGDKTQAWTIYEGHDSSALLLGTFANRNHAGIFLTFTLALAALLPTPRPHPAVLPARLGVCFLLFVAVILTQSRTAIVLALLPVMLGMARAIEGMLRGRKGISAMRAAMIGFGSLALVSFGAGAMILAAPSRIGEALERFEATDDPRRFIWDDASFSAQRYWPAGAGIGTFSEIYQVDESLENLTKRRAGRAHNDYIELTIEAGVVGLLLAAAWLAFIGWFSWRARLSSQRWVAWSGSAFLVAVALQSITDYPLRTQTILAFAGFALLLLVRLASDKPRASV